jgi:hypothetical protein
VAFLAGFLFAESATATAHQVPPDAHGPFIPPGLASRTAGAHAVQAPPEERLSDHAGTGIDYIVAPSYPAGDGPTSAHLGDLDGDDVLDLVITPLYEDSLRILSGRGDSTFDPAVRVGMSGAPGWVTGADLDRDGDHDLAVGLYSRALGIELLFNNGAGEYTVAAHYPPLVGVNFVLAGDVDGDGDVDLAALAYLASSAYVLLNDGAGGFSSPESYEIGFAPLTAVLADVDKDHDPDLVIASASCFAVWVLKNVGAGRFSPAVGYGTPGAPYGIAAGDFRRDGTLTLAVAHDDNVAMMEPIGRSYGVYEDYVVATEIYGLCAGDIDGDGDLDLATTSWRGNYVSLLLNAGNGTFSPELGFGVGSQPDFVVIGDLDRDGRPELVTTDFGSNTFSVLRPDAEAIYRARRDLEIGRSPTGLVAGDFDRDGRVDVAAVAQSSNAVAVLLNRGDSIFGVPVHYPVGGWPRSIAMADLDRDGEPDLVTANQNDLSISVLRGRGDGTFETAVSYPAGAEPFGLAAGDLDEDGDVDLAVVDHAWTQWGLVRVFLNSGNGVLGTPTTYATGYAPTSVAITDLDLDGDSDLAVTNYGHEYSGPGSISPFFNRGDGTFSAAEFITTADGPFWIAPEHLHGDSVPSLLVVNRRSTTLSIYRFGGGLHRSDIEVGIHPSHAIVSDLDGDGIPDLAVTKSDESRVLVLHGEASGGFSTPVEYGVGIEPEFLVAARFASATVPDLVVANMWSGTVSLLRSSSTPPLATPPGSDPLPPPLSCVPNPSMGEIRVHFTTTTTAPAGVRVFDVSGRCVATLFNGPLAPGRHEHVWDGETSAGRSAAGIYYVVLESRGGRSTSRVALLR